jgi:DNA-directed RNA polymerase subunit delta
MGGKQVPGHGSGDDGYDEEGYDESQRAEILEVTGGGPDDGIVLTDLDPDLGGGEDDEPDELGMVDGESGEPDDDIEQDEDDRDEDEIQADFDDDDVDEDDLDAELDDEDGNALER